LGGELEELNERAHGLAKAAGILRDLAEEAQTPAKKRRYLSTTRNVISALKGMAQENKALNLSNLLEFEKSLDSLEPERARKKGWLLEGEVPCPPIPIEVPALPSTGVIRVVILDIETTGLESSDEAVSVGALAFDVDASDGTLVREVDSYHGLRQPSVGVHPDARLAHGLSDEELAGKLFDMSVLHSIFDSADVLVAHDAQFTAWMLEPLFPGITRRQWRCTVHQMQWPPMNDYRLDTVCTEFAICRPRPHNALSDCRALAQALFKDAGRSCTYLMVTLDWWAPLTRWQWIHNLRIEESKAK
jgi:hypothetical protein